MSFANFRLGLCGLLARMLAVPQSLYAETPHVVTTAELQAKVVQQSQLREQNHHALRSCLSSSQVQIELRSAHINAQQAETAIASLSFAELAQLAAGAG